MQNFEDTVPFDPGYSTITFSFIDNISYLTNDKAQLKSLHQKKFRFIQLEPVILDLIKKSTGFYLGCMLWGAFIHYRFKNKPKEITGNNTTALSDDERSALDCASEAKFILEYIKSFDKDCRYFLNRPSKVFSEIIAILNNYVEFSGLNANFVNVKNTSDIKLPSAFEHFASLSDNQLDVLCKSIYQIIDSGKMEKLLELGFYKKDLI